MPSLFEIAKQAGFTQESFDKCLTDQKLLDEITAGARAPPTCSASRATPTFFVNGKQLTGADAREASTRCSSRCWPRAEARWSRIGVLIALLLLPCRRSWACGGAALCMRTTVGADASITHRAACRRQRLGLSDGGGHRHGRGRALQPLRRPDRHAGGRPRGDRRTRPSPTSWRRARCPRWRSGATGCARHHRAYASLTCPHCRHFHLKTFPAAQAGVHRHRQGALHPARVPDRQDVGPRQHRAALRASPTNTSTLYGKFMEQQPPGSPRRCAPTPSSRSPRRWG